MPEPQDVERICREALRHGASREEIVGILHAKGFTVIAAIKAVRAALSLSLGEAKQLVAGHPAWRAEVEANQPLHESAENAAAEERDAMRDDSAPPQATRGPEDDGEA